MLFSILENVALVLGLVYIILQVKQNKWMWPVDILCCIATICVFVHQSLWASAGLNLYYLVMGFVGLAAWTKDEKSSDEDGIRIRAMSLKTVFCSIVLFALCWAGLYMLLKASGDPAPLCDAFVGSSGVIGTYWLVKCYVENWLLWIASDLASMALCLTQGLYGLALLYTVYTVVAVVGFIKWRRNGKYI